MLVKEKFYRFNLYSIKKLIFLLKILITYFVYINLSYADLQKDLINEITTIRTLSFNFKQTIAEKEEVGKCTIKYPLLMRCDYQNLKQKTIISNGKSVAIIKKKYKKIYLYPIKTTFLFTILKKEEMLNLIRNNTPIKADSNIIIYDPNNKSKLKIIFDEKSLKLKGWEAVDVYSNDVNFVISDLIINKIIEDKFFRIPQETDL
jgi:outer membrane lipoprotein-sorting protein